MTIRNASWPRENVGPGVDSVKLGTTIPNTDSATMTLR